jgi:hypothetical protein
MQTSNWIQTYTGGKFFPLDPDPAGIKIEDIAHALSNQCRFTGHVREFYSIAQHCVLVSRHCDPTDALWGLLHDASEAYICDLSRPVKYHPQLSAYKDVERELQAAVAKRFGLSLPEPTSVKLADKRLLFTERRDLMTFMADAGWGMGLEAEPLAEKIEPWLPREAEYQYLMRYEELTSERI